MKYKVLLVDIDDTLLDFQKSEDLAIRNAFTKNNVPINEDTVNTYKKINIKYWQMFERKEIKKEDLLIQRFQELIDYYGFKGIDPVKFNNDYFDVLKNVPFELPGAYEFLDKVSKEMDIYAITNGVKQVQESRLAKVNITKFLKKVYISEEVGSQKPEKAYFDYVLKDLNIKDKSEVLILGDSITSDIIGGVKYGIDTVWYNPKGLKSDLNYTYSIKNYDEFFEVIK